MLNLNIENNPSFYRDYREGLQYLRDIDESEHEYPENQDELSKYL